MQCLCFNVITEGICQLHDETFVEYSKIRVALEKIMSQKLCTVLICYEQSFISVRSG